MTKVDISTRIFERSHGRKPRGRGGWAFILMDGSREVETFFTPSMTFSDAKVWAKAHARQNFTAPSGEIELEVAP